MSHHDNLDHLLEAARPTLGVEEERALWKEVAAKIAPAPIPSPYQSFMHSKIMTPFLIALVVLAGTAGTVAASEFSKPGDLLFPIERATERARLAIASNERAAVLRSEFATERLTELQLIIDEEEVAASATTTASSTQVTTEGEVRISVAVNALLDLLDEFADTEDRAIFLAALMAEINTITVAERSQESTSEARVKITDDRIKIKGDTYEIKYRSDDDKEKAEDDDENDDTQDRDDNQSDRGADTRNGSFEAEADVFTDKTVVMVELGGRKTSFTTTAMTRASIVDEIATRYDLAPARVDAQLDFETENRTSRADDEDNDEDEDKDDREDEDEDDREDDEENDRNDDGRDDDASSATSSVRKFEIEVEDGMADVKVEYGTEKLEYKTRYVTTALIITEVAVRTGLTIAALEAALELEIEN